MLRVEIGESSQVNRVEKKDGFRGMGKLNEPQGESEVLMGYFVKRGR